MPKPFLRWAGAKRSQAASLARYVPTTFDRYFEPFLGSGALYFHLAPARSVLGDIEGPLIDTYISVRDELPLVLNQIAQWSVDRDTYYRVRDIQPTSSAESAARFIYLNKTCWNGLYRVNKDGRFNVPFGRPKSTVILDADEAGRASSLLAGAKIQRRDFVATVAGAGPTDFVYLDPPYVTSHNQNGFLHYNETIFSWDDQMRLAALVRDLDDRGVPFVLSNADHESIRSLYDGYKMTMVERHSTLASNAVHRRKVSELVISNREPALA